MNNGDIWIIDEDMDEQDLIREVATDLKLENKFVYLTKADEVLDLLEEITEAPFLIICELHLPKMNGFKLREVILTHDERKYKSVPFIFWTTQASEQQVKDAYDLSAHGFFIKEDSYEEMKKTFLMILQYWSKSKMPAKSEDYARGAMSK
ncbi:MAG: response regulator [Gemmatimonadaceae bacterium]|nr:response regulator [Chitinophagaceae bacterium]